jgi:uncharacterized protein (DUF488 family)
VSGRVLFSVGYERRTPEELVELLHAHGITALVDVRLNPISRKPGFSKRQLETVLGGAGIAYVHERTLGNPPDNRQSFGDSGRARMREIVATSGQAALERIVERARSERIAVMCLERDHRMCHRDVIVDMAAERDDALTIKHL